MGQKRHDVEEIATPSFNFQILSHAPAPFEADPFEVWTPDVNGSLVGYGKTRQEALVHALASMMMMVRELEEFIGPTARHDAQARNL